MKSDSLIKEGVQELVSVVIPTRDRAHLVLRSVNSALSQSFSLIEVIVIVDGPDENTVKTLAQVDDSRLRVVTLPESLGGAGARNAGVEEARGQWVGFLDDDDEWLPQKLEIQIKAAAHSNYAFPIVACRVIARTPRGEYIVPRRLLVASEPLSEYLLARDTLFQGEGLIQTSMILTSKDLLQKVPFKNGLQRHQEWDWLLRVNAFEGVGIEFVAEPLAIWYAQEKRKSISSNSDWQYSLTWIKENKHLVTPRAYAAFIMTVVSSLAARQGDRKTFWLLLQEAMRSGKPKPIDFLLHTGMWVIPQDTRRRFRAYLKRAKKT